MRLGIENATDQAKWKKLLRGKRKRIALLGHPASVDHALTHSLDRLVHSKLGSVTAAFGAQHGMRGDKQYNMVETPDETDAKYGIPVFSLYGKTRTPTAAMMDTFDVLWIDLQDVGCRIYTYATTLKYMMEACARAGKSLWLLDRPNPIGRPIEGLILEPGQESFVGCAPMPMRHGLTLGELALWYKDQFKLDLDLHIVAMTGYSPLRGPGYGWPEDLDWINPSPNIPTLTSARTYPGMVMLEGTTLCEGRGTTRPFEMVGAPGLPIEKILSTMHRLAPQWLKGCAIRECFFEPTFYKHQGALCNGIQVHVAAKHYVHGQFKPYRLTALFLKALRQLLPDYDLWRNFTYEYETGRLAIDVINGGTFLRRWIDDPAAKVADLESKLRADEKAWAKISKGYWLYSGG